MKSIKKTARIAGFWYLLLVVSGIFSLMYVPAKLFVRDNAAATVHNILASESLYRVHMLNGVVGAAVFLFLALALYRLFKDVDQNLALLMAVLVIVQIPGEFAVVFTQAATLELAKGAEYLTVFNNVQREALAILFLKIDHHITVASELFWGLWLFPLGLLVIRSGFLPKFLGFWLIVNGIAYVVIFLIGSLTPQYFNSASNLALPLLMGEMAFMLWLLIMGAKESQAQQTFSGTDGLARNARPT